jgi:hypothetical protein
MNAHETDWKNCTCEECEALRDEVLLFVSRIRLEQEAAGGR